MKINEKEFYPANFKDFVHKGVLEDLFKRVTETTVSDLQNAESFDGVDFERDANGEYRLLISYVDQNGDKQQRTLQPAITDRVLTLVRQELVKHLLYYKDGGDVGVNQLEFHDDKLNLQLVDGSNVQLDLKPLVPRINVVGPDGEIIQKDLNYHVDDDKIIFVDLKGHETQLDFKLLLKVSDFQAFKEANDKKLAGKVDVDTYTTDQQDTAAQLAQKLSKLDFEKAKNDLQHDIDSKLDQATYHDDQQTLRTTLDGIKADKLSKDDFQKQRTTDLNNINDELSQKLDNSVYNRNRTADKNDLASQLDLKLDVAKYNKDQVDLNKKIDEDVKTSVSHDELDEALVNKVDRPELDNFETKAAAETAHETLVNQDVYDSDKKRLHEEIDTKANASDVAADLDKRYTKDEADAIHATLATNHSLAAQKTELEQQLNTKANASDVAADLKKVYTKDEADAQLKTATDNIKQTTDDLNNRLNTASQTANDQFTSIGNKFNDINNKINGATDQPGTKLVTENQVKALLNNLPTAGNTNTYTMALQSNKDGAVNVGNQSGLEFNQLRKNNQPINSSKDMPHNGDIVVVNDANGKAVFMYLITAVSAPVETEGTRSDGTFNLSGDLLHATSFDPTNYVDQAEFAITRDAVNSLESAITDLQQKLLINGLPQPK